MILERMEKRFASKNNQILNSTRTLLYQNERTSWIAASLVVLQKKAKVKQSDSRILTDI
jgi:hypothetical protein